MNNNDRITIALDDAYLDRTVALEELDSACHESLVGYIHDNGKANALDAYYRGMRDALRIAGYGIENEYGRHRVEEPAVIVHPSDTYEVSAECLAEVQRSLRFVDYMYMEDRKALGDDNSKVGDIQCSDDKETRAALLCERIYGMKEVLGTLGFSVELDDGAEYVIKWGDCGE